MPPPPAPDYFAQLRKRVHDLLHDINNHSAVVGNNVRYLYDASLRGMTPDQLAALRDAHLSSEETARLLHELQATIG